MADLVRYMPELAGEEAQHVGNILSGMTDEQAANFTFAYRGQRRVEMTFLLMTFFHIGRFYLGQTGMAVGYLVTFSFCFIGLIADLLNHKKLIADYNKAVADRLITVIGATGTATPYAPTQQIPTAPPTPTMVEHPPAPSEQPIESVPPREATQESQLTDTLFDTLERLADLHERGVLTDEEFQAQKDRLLNP